MAQLGCVEPICKLSYVFIPGLATSKFMVSDSEVHGKAAEGDNLMSKEIAPAVAAIVIHG